MRRRQRPRAGEKPRLEPRSRSDWTQRVQRVRGRLRLAKEAPLAEAALAACRRSTVAPDARRSRRFRVPANYRAGNNQTGRRSGQFLVEQVFDCGQDARGDGVLRPTGLTFELGHPFRGLLPRRLAPSGDKLPRRGKHIVIRKFHHGGHLTRDPSRLNVWPTFGSSPPQDGRQTPSARHVGEKRPESVECNKISVTEPFLARPQVDFTLWQPHSTQKLCGAADHLWAIQNIALENRVMSAPQADHVRKIHVH